MFSLQRGPIFYGILFRKFHRFFRSISFLHRDIRVLFRSFCSREEFRRKIVGLKLRLSHRFELAFQFVS